MVRGERRVVEPPILQVVLLGVAVPVAQRQRGRDLHPVTLRLKIAVHRGLAGSRVRVQADRAPHGDGSEHDERPGGAQRSARRLLRREEAHGLAERRGARGVMGAHRVLLLCPTRAIDELRRLLWQLCVHSSAQPCVGG